jgi:lipid A 3-O-deacylase
MRRVIFAAAAVLTFSLAVTPAQAGEAFLGVYEHDIRDRFAIGGMENGEQIVFGVRTASLDELSAIWKPHVHLLAGVNNAGGTDYLAAGFDWRFTWGQGRFYVEPGIGGAIHTGKVDLPSPFAPGITAAEQARRRHDWDTKLDLGSRLLFEPEIAVGWKATPRLSMELSWIHMSHAQLAGKQNPGLSDIGLRAVYRYGEDR